MVCAREVQDTAWCERHSCITSGWDGTDKLGLAEEAFFPANKRRRLPRMLMEFGRL